MSQIEVGDRLYSASVKFTRIVEYGVSLETLLTGQAPPPQGARFDVYVDGTVQGDKLNGTITGVDYLYVRADGRFELNIHAEITAPDGQKIAFHATGVAAQRPGGLISDLRQNVTLFSACKDYAWVNGLQVWATGVTDLTTQVVTLNGYAA